MSIKTPFTERPLVYLAGPYSHPDPVWNTNRMVRLATEMQDTGLVTIELPHLSMFWHSITPQKYEYWLAYDIAKLQRCDALYRHFGESSGADAEVVWAREHNTPVFTDIHKLYDWAENEWKGFAL